MTDPSTDDAALAYARALLTELSTANRELYSRAQAALTLDGLVITIFGAVVSSSPDDVAKTAARVTAVTGVLVLLALLSLSVSVVCAFLALYVRHWSGKPDRPASEPGNSHLWFYARIAEVEPDVFVETAAQVTSESETRIRLHQAAVMAPIITRRANWVNGAYAGAALGFLFFVTAAITYVVHVGVGG
jgi:hypothetical protein